MRAPEALSLELTPAEARALLVACVGDRPIDLRDRAMITLCLGTGMLRSSACLLRVGDVGHRGITTKLRGGGEHHVPYGPEIGRVIHAWMTWLNDAPETRLFRSVSREAVDGTVQIGGSLGPDGFYRALESRAKHARIERPITPTVFRTTFLAWCWQLQIAPSSVAAVTGYPTDARARGNRGTVLTGDAVTSAVLKLVEA
jgi:integrase